VRYNVVSGATGLIEGIGKMPARTMEDALSAWREGERLLETLPPDSAEHYRVSNAVLELRQVHASLSLDSAPEFVARSRSVVDEARSVIEHAKAASIEKAP